MKIPLLLVMLALIGCSDPFAECVDKKQDAWRKSNPTADYSKSSTANEKFRNECRHLAKT